MAFKVGTTSGLSLAAKVLSGAQENSALSAANGILRGL